MHYRSTWISDVHLGSKGSQAEKLLNFLKGNTFDNIYLVGDIIDAWAMKRNIFWPQSHNDVIQKLLKKHRKCSKILYIWGNHDEVVAQFEGLSFGGIEIVKNAIHTGVDGKKYLIMHGHELDFVTMNHSWIAWIGDIGYETLLVANRYFNKITRFFGLPYWSLSAFIKGKVKEAVKFIGNFESGIVKFAKDAKTDGVICGHIHHPEDRMMDGIRYLNCGDWVETCSAIVEHEDGRIEVVSGA